MNPEQYQNEVKTAMIGFIKAGLSPDITSFNSFSALKDFGIDSFKIIELILFLENKFHVHFPEDAYTSENLKSINSIFDAAFGKAAI